MTDKEIEADVVKFGSVAAGQGLAPMLLQLKEGTHDMFINGKQVLTFKEMSDAIFEGQLILGQVLLETKLKEQ